MKRAIEVIYTMASSELKQISTANAIGTLEKYDSGTLSATEESNLKILLGYLNQGYAQVYRDFRLLSKKETLYIPKANTKDISLPSDYTMTKRVKVISQKDHLPDVILDKHNALGVNFQRVQPFVAELLGDVPSEYVTASNLVMLSLEYFAEPEMLDLSDDILLNASHIPALVNYTAYKAHVSLNAQMQGDNNTFLMRYRSELAEAARLGYTDDSTNETVDVLRQRGFP